MGLPSLLSQTLCDEARDTYYTPFARLVPVLFGHLVRVLRARIYHSQPHPRVPPDDAPLRNRETFLVHP